MADVSNTDDIIDSRDVIARIEELEDERNDLVADLESAQEDAKAARNTLDVNEDEDETSTLERELELAESAVEAAESALEQWDSDNGDEYEALKSLADEASGSPDWEYGETLIRESYFQEYAQQLAEETGAVKGTETWPLNCIDWEKAARELKMDYFTVDFDGVDYLIRS